MNRGPALDLWDGLLLAEMALVEQGISTGLRGWGSGSQHGIWSSQPGVLYQSWVLEYGDRVGWGD